MTPFNLVLKIYSVSLPLSLQTDKHSSNEKGTRDRGSTRSAAARRRKGDRF